AAASGLAESAAHAAPRTLRPYMEAPPAPAAVGPVVSPFRPPDAMPEPPPADLDGPSPPADIAHEPADVAPRAPSTIADFLITAPPNAAQDSAAPAPVAAANDVADLA